MLHPEGEKVEFLIFRAAINNLLLRHYSELRVISYYPKLGGSWGYQMGGVLGLWP